MIRLKQILIRSGWILAAACMFFMPSLNGQIQVKPRIYLGAGVGRTMDLKIPPVSIEDEWDSNYSIINLKYPKRIFLRGQIRFYLIHAWKFSLGYQFWSHQHEYPRDNPVFWAKENKVYPYSTHINIHSLTFQWNLDYGFISTRHVMPYIVGGTGHFLGASKQFHYQYIYHPEEQELILKTMVSEEQKYKGWALFLGAGAVVFRHLYFYLGLVDLQQETLPTRRFVDLIAGVVL